MGGSLSDSNWVQNGIRISYHFEIFVIKSLLNRTVLKINSISGLTDNTRDTAGSYEVTTEHATATETYIAF